MSREPNIRELISIVESYNRDVAENKYEETSCSQCGKSLGPGNSGVSHCRDHMKSGNYDEMMTDRWGSDGLDEDPGDWDHGYNYEDNENDFEPTTNMCPECEGTGHRIAGSDHLFPGLNYECERCDGEGAIFESATRKDFRMVADLISKIEDSALRQSSANDHANMFAKQNVLFNRAKFMAAAGVDESGPELDHLRHPDDIEEEELTELDKETYASYMAKAGADAQNYAKSGMSAEMDDDPDRADTAMSRINKRMKGIGSAADALLTRYGDDEEIAPHRGDLELARSLAKGHADEFSEDEKPYATMKDGPEKYLFRKDNKQKLVGSADNKPKDGEEELEETDMDKFIREMQIAAGIIVAEDEAIEEETVEETVDEEESVDEGKLPDALKKHQFGAKDDDSDDNDSNDDNDSDDSDKEEVDEDIANWMKRFDRLDGPVNEEAKEKEVDEEEEVDEEVIEEDCDVDVEKNDDGECSPFTHADDNVAMVREEGWIDDLHGDEEEVLSRTGRSICDVEGHSFDDNSGFCSHCTYNIHDEVEEDLLLAPKGDVGPGVDEDDYRVEPELDRQTDYNAPSRFDGDDSFDMREEPNDDERIIDVGDDEDYEKYDFDSEFEAMLGGSSDPIAGGRAGSMYEMGDLRRLAGLEQIMEEPVDEEEEVDEEVVDEEVVEEDRAAGQPITDGLVAYNISDEKAYYVMADVIGNELDFGPEDQVLVPLARNDEVLSALDQQGFVKGVDFAVAGEQYEDDLQNGYNDRSFSDGQDYFPKGATNQPAVDLGPTASDQGDNPMANKMRSVEKNDVYEGMKLAYRRHRKA